MKISVIISTYNGDKYIKEELESIRIQTKQPDEVLIFDDVSGDQTVEICEQFIKANCLKNWKVTINSSNKGWRRNFMDGISEASGDVIFIADQDDIWVSTKIERMVDVMQGNDQILMLASKYIPFFNDVVPQISIVQRGMTQKIELRNRLFAMDYPGCTYCIRKEFFDEVAMYWEEDFAHDAYLWRSALVCDGLYVVEEPLHFYRRHLDSTYAVEEKKYRNRKARYEVLLLYKRYAKALLNIKTLSENARSVLKDNIRWLCRREQFYIKKNIFIGIKLIKDMSKYDTFKKYFADWIIVYKWR